MSLKNFTVILPGGCNAHCDFCDDKGDKYAPEDYMKQLERAIDTLPDDFNQVSVTGGETTISKYLRPVLLLLKNCGQFDKIVLTTNGARLRKVAADCLPFIDHLNISRHKHTDEANNRVFGTKGVLQIKDYRYVTDMAHKFGVDVCINTVYTSRSAWTRDTYEHFVRDMTGLGVDKFALRYDQREDSLEETELERKFWAYKVLHRGGCPVCRSHTIQVHGAHVTFKAAFNEPSQALNGSEGLYELVFHEDGTLSEDWSKKMVVKKKVKSPMKLYTQEDLDKAVRRATRAQQLVASRTSIGSGCGRTTGCG